MITPVWIVGFTGHRPKNSPGRSSAELEHFAPLIRRELSALQAKAVAQGGRAEFLCGVAAGADVIAAREASALGMAVHVILPMPEHEFEKDFAGPEFQEDLVMARRFIQEAKDGVNGGTFRVMIGTQLRNECYYDLGAQIVYASDILLALWDGQPPSPVATSGSDSAGRGGTADVIDLAKGDCMPYLRGKSTKHGYVWRSTPIRLINTITQEVTGSIDDFASGTDAGLAEIKAIQHAADAEHGIQKPLETVQSLMEFIDRGAKDWAGRLRRHLLGGSLLHFVASLTAAVSAGIQKTAMGKWTPTGLAAIELALVLAAIGIMLWSHWKHAQARWLELRLATELTRGLVASSRLVDPLFPIATDHLPGWRRFCLSVGLTIWQDKATRPSCADSPDAAQACLEEDKQHYMTQRINDQLHHYQTYDPHKRHWWHGCAHIAGPATSVLAVVFIVIALMHKVDQAMHSDAQHHDPKLWESLLYYFLPIALPLIAGAIASLQSVTDAKRRAQVYPEMVERLRSAQQLLPALRTPTSLRRFVHRTEEILLDELVGWYAAAKGISH